MNPAYECLHKEMLQDIGRTIQLDLPEPEKIGSCFWVAANHWDELKKRICPSVFDDPDTEIDFFRNVKPRFTGYIQYFTIVSEALLFVPEKRGNEITYWEEEMKRYNIFCNKHEEFVAYYKSGNTDMDAHYFTRASEDSPNLHPLMTYDADKKFCSTHDWVIRGLVAHDLYHEFAKNKHEAMRIWF